MFVQVIQGTVTDPDLLRRQLDRWRSELKPGAKGYLGATSGITPDGRTIALVRFDSEQAAQANSERPEQGAWWNETEKAFGQVSFQNCREVDLMMGGGSTDAGFVQVLQGRVKDQDEFRRRGREMEAQLQERRPDILGMLTAWHGDGAFTTAAYFRSEADARQQEQASENDPTRAEFMAMLDGPPTFFDLPQPDLD